jgi:3-oxoacyl-[acyl-carrier-protein] synthase-3
VIDLYDRDCMIFSDGSGATVLEALDGNATSSGIMGTAAQSYSVDEAYFINMGKSYLPDADPGIRYLKMKGRKVYEFAIKVVPQAMKACIEKSDVKITDVKKIFIHQANEKMDDVIIRNMYKLFGYSQPPQNIMPMNIRELGNSSVATIPTLLDMVRRGQLPDHEVQKGDIVVFASVGAGMNINAACYRM